MNKTGKNPYPAGAWIQVCDVHVYPKIKALKKGSANYGSRAQSGHCLFVNEVLLEYSHAHLLTIICLFLLQLKPHGL